MTSYINNKKLKRLALVLGNQLFPIEQQKIDKDATIFMCEDYDLCSAFIYDCRYTTILEIIWIGMK